MSYCTRQALCDKFKKYIQVNEDKDLYTIFDYKKRLSKGRQGKVGILHCNTLKDTCVFKISLYNDFLIQNEFYTMQYLEDNIYDCCPYFCRSIDMIESKQNKGHKHKGNPFVPSDVNIKDSVLLLENVKDSEKVSLAIENMSSFQICNLVKNMLMIINILQKHCRFTHYDLHTDNILLKKCRPDTLNMYIIGNNTYIYNSCGYIPYIIDFGFSYVQTDSTQYFWRNMEFTNIGFFCDRFDPIADPKMFLLSITDELNYRKDSNSHRLNNIIQNLFHTLPIDKESGWLKTKTQNISEYIADIFDPLINNKKKSDKKYCIFDKEPYFCIELLSSLVILPMQSQKISKTRVYLNTWLTEMNKIFKVVKNSKIMLCVMKNIINAIREIRSDYLSNNQTSNKHSKKYFNDILFQSVSDFISFVDITKTVHIDKLICSTIGLSQCIEGLSYRLMEGMSRVHNGYLNQMPTNNVTDMLNIININFPTVYQFKLGQNIVVHDTNRKNMTTLQVTPDILNKLSGRNRNEIQNILNNVYLSSLNELP